MGHDPLLDDLADNGGPTMTYALMDGSPAIDAGSNPLGLTTDQRGDGFPRERSAPDIGSYEARLRPTLGYLDSARDTATRGESVLLTAQEASDADGSVAEVRFFLDANGDGEGQGAELIGTDTDGADGYTLDYTVESDAAYGDRTLFAVAIDNEGLMSDAAVTRITVVNVPPTLTGLSGSSSQFAQGDSLSLSVDGAADEDGEISEVRFYLDANGDGVGQESEILGTDADGSDGYSYTLTPAQSAALALGTATFLAQALDEGGLISEPRSVSAEILYSLRAGTGSVAVGSSTGDTTFWTGFVNEAGDVILFDTTSNDATNLTLAAGATKATGDVVVYTDPKEDVLYAAYPSADGLIVAHLHPEQGTWSHRNLTEEASLDTDDGPTRSLTRFTSTGATSQVVVIAGIDAAGDLVGFRQTGERANGAWEWEFIDITADLDSRGMATPDLAYITSYVTPWNQWTIAGIDLNGDIQGIWVNVATFTTWRVDNLSDLYGTPTLSGQLTVIQTSWKAINLAGTDDDGNVIVTWWVPSFKGSWAVSDLTESQGGTPLASGRITGWVTSWGAMNFAGLDADGEVVAYWWTPSTPWTVSTLTGNLGSETIRPTSSLDSHVSDAGTMNIVGTDDDSGNVLRLWWTPNDDGRWKLNDLTELAVRT